APLAVQDLLAAMRFAVQPLDDLNLACLLVSPLIGWSQERLMDIAAGREPGSLWRLVREHPECAADAAILGAILNDADYLTPARFLERLLSGSLGGRRKLFARLGMAARDPIDELINTALAFEREEGGSFEHFLAWFARGDVEVKGDPDQANDEVRVMTVHGAKGLEAPVVIIADAHLNPDDMGAHDDPILAPLGDGDIPLSRSGTKSLPARIAELHADDKRADLLEHMRLLYVAMTRAIDRLVVAGMEPAHGLKPNAWHVRVEAGLKRLGAVEVEGATGWGSALRYARDGEGRRSPSGDKDASVRVESQVTVPDWARRSAPIEERPPRPLAPSAMAKDDVAAAPPSPALRAAAQRGTWIHSLLERLVEVTPERRREAALAWLERAAGVSEAADREEIADQVCRVLTNSDFAPLFGPGSLGEAPLAATLPDGRVIAGTMDRLLVEDERVSVIDFKSGRVPTNASSIPAAHQAQMQAYVDALRVIFPGRAVRSALLYTAGPALFELSMG
ncbi:MAG: 3'-5' exonuclease, partial [Sphingomicrobium sp.]